MPAAYRLVAQPDGRQVQAVQRVADGAFVPFDPANGDYVEFQQWCAEGNEPEPAAD